MAKGHVFLRGMTSETYGLKLQPADNPFGRGRRQGRRSGDSDQSRTLVAGAAPVTTRS